MYTLVGAPTTRAIRVMWMLEELGEPYDLVPAAPHSPDVAALNPSGKVPVLKVGDRVLTESVAICQFLADRHGKLTFPAGTVERARQDGFTQFAVDVLEGALWTAAKNSFIHPKDLRVPAVKPVCAAEFEAGLAYLAQTLGEGPFVMGEVFTVPDILLGHCSKWAQAAKFSLPSEGVLADYFARVTSRPALQAAQKRGANATS
ncbi:glutathione S-transferase family protein [Stappia sp.]|uniref:glutathione S-transferase family protein n=1 Tax=Stappia sp. TaxID=1870903 RepID=UPI003A98F98A